MTGMEDVLAMIEDLVFEGTGHHLLRDGRDGSFTHTAALLADMLSTAGFGNLHDAWAEGVATALNHAIENDDGITLRLEHLDGRPWTNPYPKVSET